MLLLNLSNFAVSNINSRENPAVRSQLAATQAHHEASHQISAVPRQRRALVGKSVVVKGVPQLPFPIRLFPGARAIGQMSKRQEKALVIS